MLRHILLLARSYQIKEIVAFALTSDSADVAYLSQEIVRLKQARERARRSMRRAPVDKLVPVGRTLREV